MADSHDAMADAVAAYVLGAGDERENAAVRSHLEDCASCQALARRLSATVATLPLAVDDVPAPPGLRRRVLSLTPPLSRRAREAGPARRSWLIPVAAAALVAFALGGGLGYGLGAALTRPAPSSAVVHAAMTGGGALAGGRAEVIDLRQDGYTLIGFRGMPQPAAG